MSPASSYAAILPLLLECHNLRVRYPIYKYVFISIIFALSIRNIVYVFVKDKSEPCYMEIGKQAYEKNLQKQVCKMAA